MDKEQLETNIAALELLVNETADKSIDFRAQLEQAKKDLGKIALPPVVFDDITEAIELAVENYDFSDTDNFDIEYGIEYDGRVHCESHELSDSSALVEEICNAVYKLFTEMECPEDELDTTEPDNHPVENLQN